MMERRALRVPYPRLNRLNLLLRRMIREDTPPREIQQPTTGWQALFPETKNGLTGYNRLDKTGTTDNQISQFSRCNACLKLKPRGIYVLILSPLPCSKR